MKLMIDYISDLHLDFYKYPILKYLIEEKQSNILIISGDIGHNLKQNFEFIKELKKSYEHIILVLGNHDYYLTSLSGKYFDNDFNFKTSFEKVEKSRKLYNSIEGVNCLNGEIIYIEGVAFGGADSWYSNAYLKKHFNKFSSKKDTLKLWKDTLNDSHAIYGVNENTNINFFEEIYDKEMIKLNNIKKDCQVMITHVNPSPLIQHQDPKYISCKDTTFFNFEGKEIYSEGFIKYWFFGHTHKEIKYIIDETNFFCNPLGYPGESASKYSYLRSVLLEF